MRRILFQNNLRYTFLIVGLVFNFSLLEAQDQKNPQFYIRNYLKTGDTIHLAGALDDINKEFVRYNGDELGKLLFAGEKRAEQENYRDRVLFYSLIRQYYAAAGNRPKTLEYALKQYKSISGKGDSEALLWILIDIGNLFYDESEFDQALNFYGKAEIIGLKKPVPYQLSVVYLNLGLAYQEKLDYHNALKYLHKSSHYRIQDKNIRMASSTFVRIATAHIKLAEADSALKYIRLAEEYYYRKGSGEQAMTEMPMYIEMVWFEYYGLVKDHKKAVGHFKKAQEYAVKYNMIYDYYSNIFYEVKYYTDRGEHQLAIDKMMATLPFFKKNQLPDEQRYVYKSIGTLYSKLNQPDKASEYLMKYLLLDDSIKKSSRQSQLDVMRSIAAVYESDANLERTRKNLEIEKINNKLRVKERNTSIWIAALALFGIAILSGSFLNLKRNRKQLLSLHRQLKEQNKEIRLNSLELERSNQIKDKLFSIIAHDLRNPLNRLMAELSIAKNSLPQNRLLDPMENTLKETINLFEGLLQWSKLDKNQSIYSPVKVNLNENINKIIAFYLPEIKARNLHIVNNSAAVTVLADNNILQTLLRNLLSNAIASVSKDGNSGTIEIDTNIQANSTVEIIFSDSGAGFPQEIIDGFNQEEDVTNGRGLGLSICKVLARMSGWKMKISNESKLNGAKIVLQLPAYRYNEIETGKLEILELPSEWKIRLAPVKNFKFYQISEIRRFIRSLGEIGNRVTENWIAQLEESVREGNDSNFRKLVEMVGTGSEEIEE